MSSLQNYFYPQSRSTLKFRQSYTLATCLMSMVLLPWLVQIRSVNLKKVRLQQLMLLLGMQVLWQPKQLRNGVHGLLVLQAVRRNAVGLKMNAAQTLQQTTKIRMLVNVSMNQHQMVQILFSRTLEARSLMPFLTESTTMRLLRFVE